MSNRNLQIHPLIASAVIAGAFALQGWMLKEISTLKENVAGLRAELSIHTQTQKSISYENKVQGQTQKRPNPVS
jgi:hypothetical protein